jgi:uncharacterized protein (TIGR03435 family)
MSRRIDSHALLAMVCLLSVPLTDAQSPTARPAFEVASVKPDARGGNASYVQASPGRLSPTNFSLRGLIVFAYGVRDYQISGDPAWLGSDYYDIQAKAEGNAPVKQMEGPMLQALLEDRFRLRLHRETRQLPAFELSVAKGGPRLQRSKEGSCVPYSLDAPAPPPPARGEPRPVFCGFPHWGVEGSNRTLDGIGIGMANLASSLSRSELHRTVTDRTGLSGTFDVHLKWAPDAGEPSADSAGPSLLIALQEQLGLKLESTRAPTEVLVIDHIDRAPTGN